MSLTRITLVRFSDLLADRLRNVSELCRHRFHGHALRPVPVARSDRVHLIRPLCAVQFRSRDLLRHSVPQIHCGMRSKSAAEETREYGRKAGGSRHRHRAQYVHVVGHSERGAEGFESTIVQLTRTYPTSLYLTSLTRYR